MAVPYTGEVTTIYRRCWITRDQEVQTMYKAQIKHVYLQFVLTLSKLSKNYFGTLRKLQTMY